MAVTVLLSGGLTDHGIEVSARLNAAAASCRLVVSTSSDLNSPVYGAAVAPNANLWVKLSIAGLAPSTVYWYGVERDGVLDAKRGRFRTPATRGTPGTFTVIVAACSNSGNGLIWDRMRERVESGEVDLTIHPGDYHYNEILTNDESLFRAAFEAQFNRSRINAFQAAGPFAYMPDDHDGPGGNNSDGTGAARPAMAANYQAIIPSYNLPAGLGDQPLYHDFDILTTRFFMLDLRSRRSPRTDPDTAAKTQMGATQKAWFFDRLLDAKADPAIKHYAVVSGQVWNAWMGGAYETIDTWAEYNTERQELLDFFAANDLNDYMQILAGDAHLVGPDDGTNSPGGIPSLQSAPIWGTSSGEGKGGPYSHGRFYSGSTFHQYSTVKVEDLDTERAVQVTWTSYRVDNTTGVETQLYSPLSFVTGPGPSGLPASALSFARRKVWDGSAWVTATRKVWDGAAWARTLTRVGE